jgi:hypothetical protein
LVKTEMVKSGRLLAILMAVESPAIPEPKISTSD